MTVPRKRIGYGVSSKVPVTYIDKNGHERTKRETRYYASAKHVMEYLTGFYAPADNPAQRKWKRDFGGVTSYQYKTLDEAIKAGIHPDDYLNVYKIMKIYFAQPKMKLVYNDTSRPYIKGAVEKLMHPTFKHILEDTTHNNVGTDQIQKLDRPKNGRKEIVVKSLHEAIVTEMERGLLKHAQTIQNKNEVRETLEANGESQEGFNIEECTQYNDNIVESTPVITSTNVHGKNDMMHNSLRMQNNGYSFTKEQACAFERLVYRKNGVLTFFVARYFGDRHYWKATNGSDMALGTTKKERWAALVFWRCAHVDVAHLKTEAIRKRVGYDVIVPYKDKNGKVQTTKKKTYLVNAKHVMEYLTGFYALGDNPVKRASKRTVGGISSHPYKTLPDAIKAGIDPEDYVTVYKAMKVYFGYGPTKARYNNKEFPYEKGAVEKLMHPTFKHILEDTTHASVDASAETGTFGDNKVPVQGLPNHAFSKETDHMLHQPLISTDEKYGVHTSSYGSCSTKAYVACGFVAASSLCTTNDE